MGLLDFFRRTPELEEQRQALPFAEWLNYFTYGANLYPTTGVGSSMGRTEDIGQGLTAYVDGLLRANGIVFTCVALRLRIFSDVRFAFRELTSEGRPGKVGFPVDGRNPASRGMRLLQNPDDGWTTGDMLARMIQDIDLGGNAFVLRRDDRLIRLRPDWTKIVIGSRDPDATIWDLNSRVLGYLYQEGGPAGGKDPIVLFPEEVAHWAPQPDPLSPRRGMSWMTPIVREILADNAATSHKGAFFSNDGTVNQQLVFEKGTTKEQYDMAREAFNAGHVGSENAWKTLFVLGAHLEKVGTDLKDMDFTALQGRFETRVAAASGVHPVLAAFSEGLQGSSLNAGNFTSARRATADMTFRPLWRNLCGSLAHLIETPDRQELWYDDRDCMFLQEDRKDAAEIQRIQAETIAALVKEGFEPDSVVDAVIAEDQSLLKHSGALSVQLHDPSKTPAPEAPPANVNGNGSQSLPVGAG